ncbi:MAG: TonB C-terminal domain-containing protein, partial [Candidatus Thioglobus sp.]|uniref:TonB C-terminal domain-containing protein n=1 Tax=Candidatus Thioglobus sp. TaxID=2026721 RepID=UPI00261F633A
EKLRKAEASKFEKEQDTRSLKKEIQAEEDQEREIAQEDILNELKANYVNQIASRVKEKWRYQGAKDDWGCDVYILQDINGKVQTVNLQSCNVENNAKSKAFKDAIERAVYKASPLPPAPDQSVFDREILFHFRVN